MLLRIFVKAFIVLQIINLYPLKKPLLLSGIFTGKVRKTGRAKKALKITELEKGKIAITAQPLLQTPLPPRLTRLAKLTLAVLFF
ncbi:hypothetical protein GGTG_05274 [Gaeumannomyces tritici R3-111a-1]|uniref:Uncharacterized protein n=1 Tax=Gaeumannomyces tritici (strain R3-111a-1) TaxID=644352 RepID=J3NVF9_GAET3|nr:hypothetical protein GGTG_05274 [Gaeumannomyces tritici R3-111a-1]EJT75337.1 hypothetical protein GGTG_05274 [Gaeumannomyces tritici R3-111a-1]